MNLTFNKIKAFVKKDFTLLVSYQVFFIMQIIEGPLILATFYFVSKLFSSQTNTYLAPYGGEYFPFVFLGIAFFTYMSVMFTTFSQVFRNEQLTGTLEAIFVTPVRYSLVLISSAGWSLILASFTAVIYCVFGFFILKPDLAGIDLGACLVILFLSIVCFVSIGMLSGGFIMLFKQGNPIKWLIRGVTGLLGGVYYPVEILPPYLKSISLCLPITYSLRALRRAVFNKASFLDLSKDIEILLVFAIFLLLLALVFFKYAVNKNKEKGRLGFY